MEFGQHNSGKEVLDIDFEKSYMIFNTKLSICKEIF